MFKRSGGQEVLGTLCTEVNVLSALVQTASQGHQYAKEGVFPGICETRSSILNCMKEFN